MSNQFLKAKFPNLLNNVDDKIIAIHDNGRIALRHNWDDTYTILTLRSSDKVYKAWFTKSFSDFIEAMTYFENVCRNSNEREKTEKNLRTS
jgi:hypothetical protein